MVQAELRRCFEHWGRPASVRVDNGYPWGSCGDLPTPLALWLIGLGIEVIWNPPRRPQDNGVVERSQGVASNWAEPDRCRNPAELQRRLNEEDRVQRESYPHGSFRSRLEAYPSLIHSGRPYSVAFERGAVVLTGGAGSTGWGDNAPPGGLQREDRSVPREALCGDGDPRLGGGGPI